MRADFFSLRINWEHNERERSPLVQNSFWYSSNLCRTFHSRATCDTVKCMKSKQDCFYMEILSRPEGIYKMNDSACAEWKSKKPVMLVWFCYIHLKCIKRQKGRSGEMKGHGGAEDWTLVIPALRMLSQQWASGTMLLLQNPVVTYCHRCQSVYLSRDCRWSQLWSWHGRSWKVGWGSLQSCCWLSPIQCYLGSFSA